MSFFDPLGQNNTGATTTRFYGKYRGTVRNNVDPQRIGRIQVIVPDVSSSVLTSWALPCAPVAGNSTGMFAIPPVDAAVWVEFEQGDPDYPIWVGCFWGAASEVPALAHPDKLPLSHITLQTVARHGIVISDLPGPTGGILLQSPGGAKIIINDTGITIENGQGASLKLVGPTVNVNSGALTVT
jgi:uncharacterized protein involved in type VI secretion and phage assembly